MAQVGEVTIGLQFDTKGASSDLKKLENEATTSGNAIATKLGNGAKIAGKAIATGLAVGITAIGVLGKKSIEAYADYEQLVGGVDTLFKESSETVQNYADMAYKTAGLSANAYMETVTSFSASLLQGLNGDTAAAAEMANLAVTDMADNANKMGTDMQRIQDAYQGFAKQNYTMLDNLKLGYGGTATEMARLINDSGVLGDTMTVTAETVNSVSFDKMVEAIHVIQTQMGITGTTAAEAADTITGSLNSTMSAWENVLASFGTGSDEQIAEAINGLVESAGNLVKNITNILPNVVDGIVSMLDSLIPQIPILVQRLLPSLIQGAVQLINGIIAAFPQFLQALQASLPQLISGVMTIISSLIQNIGPILQAITQIILALAVELTKPENLTAIFNAAIELLLSLVRAIPDILTALIEALPTIIDGVIQFLTDPATIAKLIEASVTLFLALVQAVPQILGALISAFGKIFGSLWENVSKMFTQFFGNFGETVSGVFKAAVNGVLGFIEGFINAPINILNGFIGLINGAFGWIGVNLGTIGLVQLPRLAEGGVAQGSVIANIGEDGKEAVIPLERNTGNWSGLLAKALADEFEQDGLGGVNVTMNNYINNDLDVQEIGRKMVTSIRMAS